MADRRLIQVRKDVAESLKMQRFRGINYGPAPFFSVIKEVPPDHIYVEDYRGVSYVIAIKEPEGLNGRFENLRVLANAAVELCK